MTTYIIQRFEKKDLELLMLNSFMVGRPIQGVNLDTDYEWIDSGTCIMKVSLEEGTKF